MCSAYSLPYFPETRHRLVPLPFSYMQMSIIEVAEWWAVHICQWMMSPPALCEPMKHKSEPSVGKLHLNSKIFTTLPDRKPFSLFCLFVCFFLSLCLSFFDVYFLLLCPPWSDSLEATWGMPLRRPLWWAILLHHTTRPLLPAALLGKYSALETDRLHHRCHREHLVITSRAQPPAEFTELSASPVTRSCLCVSLLETLDVLNNPTRPRPKFSTCNISLRK